MPKILMIDNYDSFTYNLIYLLKSCKGVSVDVFCNDQIKIEAIKKYDQIVLSPGSGLPQQAGIMMKLLKTYASSKSILGVCLGMQAIAIHYNATLTNLKQVCHGQATPIKVIRQNAILKGCPQHFVVGRYHSWVINPNSLPAEFTVNAVDEQNNIMSISHQTDNVHGVQFHPESILSRHGQKIINNWLKL